MSLQLESNPTALAELAERLDGRPVPGLRMTEAQFDRWCTEDIKAEWIDGKVIVVAPASGEHSDLNFWIMRLLADFVERRELGIVRGPEFLVRLASQKRRRCPDVMFVSNSRAGMLRPTYMEGAPDLIMEIVSPDSESRDWRDKYLDYEAAGVREYWVIDKRSQKIEAYALSRKKTFERLEEKRDAIQSKVLRGFYLKPAWLWRSPLPKLSEIAKELKLR